MQTINIADTQVPLYDLRDWQSLDDARAVLERATIIWGAHRADTTKCALFYGKQFLKAMVEGALGPRHEYVAVAILLDYGSDELEELCDIVEEIKGVHEFGLD